jgi:hypothetical protein
MPVYDISGTPYSANAAIDILVDEGTAPPIVATTAASEETYLAMVTFFSTMPALTTDGSDNITNTTPEWEDLMSWATQGYSAADDYSSDAVLEYLLLLFQVQANTDSYPAPYWKSPTGSISSLTQLTALSWLIYLMRSVYKSAGYAEPVQV